MHLDTNVYPRLPTSNFKWLTDQEMEELDVKMIPDHSPRGYILEHDLGKCYFYI